MAKLLSPSDGLIAQLYHKLWCKCTCTQLTKVSKLFDEGQVSATSQLEMESAGGQIVPQPKEILCDTLVTYNYAFDPKEAPDESPLTSPTTVVNNKSDANWQGVDFQMFNQRIR